MNPFDELNKAFERKYTQDQNLEFKILVRRDKLFGRWAAEKAGLSGEEADAFVRSVIDSEVASHSVLHKVFQDLNALGHPISENELQSKLVELQELAREQVGKEGVDPTIFTKDHLF